MAMFGESGLPPGFHQDVMDALPEDKEGKKRLAEEIKGRAKGSLGSKNYPEAIALYSKAIEVMKGEVGEEGYVAILFANRSMCKLGMGRALEAETDATEAIERDASYVKGYYRKAMASIKLEKYESAKETLLAGLARKPEDKELTTQMDNVERLIKNPPKKAESAKKAAAKPATIPKVSAGAPVPKSVKEETVINDAPQSEADRIRGYKLTSDGRKTSYFNNEMDAKTKELIGDIAPKKISAPVSAAAEPVTTDKGSAWNAAGTFESKNLTKWAKDAIRDRCNKIVAGAGAGGDGSASASARVTSITSDGDAEIVSNRGKRKHIYDFTVTVKFSVTGKFGGVVKGSLNINDVDADEGGEYEVSDYVIDDAHKADKLDIDAGKELVKDQKNPQGLLQKIFVELDAFRAEFKSK